MLHFCVYVVIFYFERSPGLVCQLIHSIDLFQYVVLICWNIFVSIENTIFPHFQVFVFVIICKGLNSIKLQTIRIFP